MKSMFAVPVLAVAFTCVGCSAVYGVKYDYDRHADFSRFQTYYWLPGNESAASDSLNIKRVREAVDNALARKGLRKTSQCPELLVSEELATKSVVGIRTRGDRRGYGRSSRVGSYQYEQGSLSLDFVDAASKELLWRGTANAEIDQEQTPEEREKLINEAVNGILKNFPPPRTIERGR